MDRKQTVIVLLLVAAFAIFVQGLKAMRHNRFQAAERAALALGDIDDTPYHVSSEEMAHDRARANARGRGGLRLAGGPSAASQFNQYDFGGVKVVAENAKGKESVKKKKKKNGRGKADEKKNILQDDRPYYAQTPKETIPDSGAGGGGGATTVNNGVNKNQNLPVTYQDWAKLILGSPSPKNVQMLIDYYHSGMVSGEIFYAILEAMMAENDSQQQKLAITAAGATQSAGSFGFLVQVEKNPPSSEDANLARTEILDYQYLPSVGILRAVFSAYLNDATTTQAAAAVLQSSTNMYLANRAPSSTTTPAAGATDAGNTPNGVTAAALIHAYAGFAPILTQVITTYKTNASIAGPAQQALAQINNIIPPPPAIH